MCNYEYTPLHKTLYDDNIKVVIQQRHANVEEKDNNGALGIFKKL